MKELIRISAKQAYAVAQHYRLSEQAINYLKPELTPAAFIFQLEQNQLIEDAIKFLAHALPKRLAVWWVCLVAESVTERNTASLDYQAFIAAEHWVKNPTEENRRTAEKIAAKTLFSSAASWAATAAFWCTGSLASADMPMVAAPPYLYAHAVYGGIGLAAVTPTPDEYQEKMRHYFQLGLALAQGESGKPATASAKAGGVIA